MSTDDLKKEIVQQKFYFTSRHRKLKAVYCMRRDVVERRVFTVTGQRPAEEDVERLIETGESETIFQKAILEQGRGQVRFPSPAAARELDHDPTQSDSGACGANPLPVLHDSRATARSLLCKTATTQLEQAPA